jgi:hypothetical protein
VRSHVALFERQCDRHVDALNDERAFRPLQTRLKVTLHAIIAEKGHAGCEVDHTAKPFSRLRGRARRSAVNFTRLRVRGGTGVDEQIADVVDDP